jgi:signal transduction histidine kinase
VAGKILIVDDDPLICRIIAAAAQEASLVPAIAHDLQKARELARLDPPDLVFCDIFLPDGPGTTLIGYLRRLDAQVEVVLITASSRFDLVVEAIREGASDFLEKPISREQLGATLHRVLTRRANRQAPAEPGGRGSALIVDEDAETLRAMGNLLAEVGVTSYQAQTVEEAHSGLSERMPDVVITDVFFQKGSGIDLLKRVKSRYPQLPVVMVTASNKPEVAIQALRAGAFDVAVKPIDRDEFQRAVLTARRFKLAIDEQSRMQRELEAFRAGLAHLQQTMEQRVDERVAVAVRAHDEAVRVLRSLSSGVLVLDRDLRVKEMNQAAEQLLAVPRHRMLGRALDEFAPLASFVKTALQTLHTGHSFNNLEMDLTVDEARRTIGYGVGPMVGAEAGGVLVHFQDITAKRRLEAYLRQSDRLITLGMMAADITHEINNPLGVALGFADLLLPHASEPDLVQTYSRKIQAAIGKAVDVTGRLLHLVRAPATDLRPSDLHQAIGNVCGLLERKLQASSVELEVKLGAQVAEIEGDPVELEQLFLNLMVNACDASPNGGKIRITSANYSGIVEVQVSDSGLGIPSRQLPHVFEPFYTTKEPGKGTGLGLSICRNIVDRHGGTIRADSEAGKGSVFTVRLPLVGQGRTAIPGPGPVAPPRATERRAPGLGGVLVADEATAGLCRIWLEEAGFPVRVYADVLALQRSLGSDRPATLLLNLAIQGLDGVDFLRRVHAEKLAGSVLIMGGTAQAGLLEALEDIPPYRVLSAPLTGEALRSAATQLQMACAPAPPPGGPTAQN